jgi:glycosyltransferase involved in cell wall biosynthesis
MNQLVFDSPLINEKVDKDLLEIKFSDSLSQLRKWRPGKIAKFIRLLFMLIIKMIHKKPDYIYFSLMPAGWGFLRDLFFVLIIKVFRVRPIYHLHNRGIQRNSGFAFCLPIYRFVFNNSLLIHLSDHLMQTEINSLNLINCTQRVIPNGIQIIEPEFPAMKIDGIIRLLFLSNLFAAKGLDDLLLVFHNLLKKFPELELVVAGAFPSTRQEKRIMNLVSTYQLGNKVTFCGEVYGRTKYYTYLNADIFVFPSYFSQECFPLVILEAMQFGLPVVATGEGAIPEIIADGETGFITGARDTNALEEKISRLIESPELRLLMGNNARKLFGEKYSAAHFEEKMRAFYDSYLY